MNDVLDIAKRERAVAAEYLATLVRAWINSERQEFWEQPIAKALVGYDAATHVLDSLLVGNHAAD